jgi:hypothetical protein
MDLWKAALGFDCRIRRAPTSIRPARRAAARAADIAAAAAEITAEAAWDTGRAVSRAAALDDLRRLVALGLGRPGTLGKPINPAEEGLLGPLWPGGAPAWYTRPPTPSAEPTTPPAIRDD